MGKKYVYSFEEVKHANTEEWQFALGNKGAQLSEMTAIGLPVPLGFQITTEACRDFYVAGKKWPAGLESQVKQKLAELEKKLGKRFGDKKDPLFVSVRSGSYVSMPGMMDTVLNLGMNDDTAAAFAEKTGNKRGAVDSYRRFIQMFGDVVMEVEHARFEEILHRKKDTKGVQFDTELTADDLKEVIDEYKAMVKKETGKLFPTDPWQQLKMGIDAVFSSWNTPRAVSYRRINKLRGDAGTGVTVQSMVFGNMGETSGTGVSFTRNPATGKKEHYGEFLINAQGEDVVAGIRTPKPIDELGKLLPAVYKQLLNVYGLLEKHYKDLQDFEFTIENNKLYLLQTRSGKRTAHAAMKIAVDMEKEGLVTKEQAVMMVKPDQLNQLLHEQLDPVAKKEAQVVAKGLPASPGAAVGKVVFTAERAKQLVDEDPHTKLILVRLETSPEDIEGIHVAQGMLTSRGGMTSHCAVVARGMGKCAVVGCGDISINEEGKFFTVKMKGGELRFNEMDWISLDGGAGEVFGKQLPLVEPRMSGDFGILMKWADEFRRLGIRTNADTPKDAQVAKDFGVEGIGLCRTEHMFFEGERIKAMREMILAENTEGRKKALAKLLPYQKEDFKGLFKVMSGKPIIVRFLDPPLHEFLPKEECEIKALAEELGFTVEKIKQVIVSLHEFNPMLGFRGCRLGVVYPEISEMQARAIFEAAIEAKQEGFDPMPEIEVPNVITVKEFRLIKEIISNVAKELDIEGRKIHYKVGTMIEFPRACITADELATEADFFSFGTNDLTQTTLGFSRDDAGKFIPLYIERGALEQDPFQTIDQQGVGKLMIMAVEKGRSVKPHLDIGICGEHGGEPASVEFCHRIGLSNVSCSPFRVPIARLAAAQAAIKEKMKAGKAAPKGERAKKKAKK
ncbi:MAG: pyruvate, phosphate dikinase [Candidatus Diapherotrites archaeon]|nr:pyruvate, phosphate dikinase [Candidatus Diapherotrites archaeon]